MLSASYDERASAADLAAATGRAARWAAAWQGGALALSLLLLAVLYRLIEPAEFGLAGLALVTVSLARSLGSWGMPAALVQTECLTASQVGPLVRVQLALGLATTLGIVILAPVSEWIYRAPGLCHLTWGLAGTALVSAAGTTHLALLERRLALKPLAILRLAAQIAGGMSAVTAARAGWGAWSLVAQQQAEFAVLTLGAVACEPAQLPSAKRGDSLPALAARGGTYAAAGMVFQLARDCDKLLLGCLLGATAAGQAVVGGYVQAFNLVQRPLGLVCTPITAVLLPALSRANALPAGSFGPLAAAGYRTTALLLWPIGAALLVEADDALAVLAGPAWQGAGEFLRALAPLLFAQGFIQIAGSLFAARGMMRELLYGALVVGLLLVQGCVGGFWLGEHFQLAAAPAGGALGLAWGVSLTVALVLAGPYTLFCWHATGVAWRSVVKELRAPAVATAALLLAALGARFACGVWNLGPTPRLFITAVAGGAAYLAFTVGRRKPRSNAGPLA